MGISLDSITAFGVEIGISDPCPCDSGRRVYECCGDGAGLYKRPATVPDTRQPVAYAHPQCYASETLRCSKQGSGEHYLTRKVMEYVTENGQGKLKGFEFGTIPARGAIGRVLCRAHNSALSSLDDEIVRLVKTIHAPRPGLALFNGQDIERWMVKAVLGMVAAGVVRTGGTRFELRRRNDWVRYLFEPNFKIRPRAGLYLGAPHENHEALLKVGLIDDRPELVALEVVIAGVPLIMAAYPPQPRVAMFRNAGHHPRAFQPRGGAVIGFCWPEHRERYLP